MATLAERAREPEGDASDQDSLDSLSLPNSGIESKPCAEVEPSFEHVFVGLASERRPPRCDSTSNLASSVVKGYPANHEGEKQADQQGGEESWGDQRGLSVEQEELEKESPIAEADSARQSLGLKYDTNAVDRNNAIPSSYTASRNGDDVDQRNEDHANNITVNLRVVEEKDEKGVSRSNDLKLRRWLICAVIFLLCLVIVLASLLVNGRNNEEQGLRGGEVQATIELKPTTMPVSPEPTASESPPTINRPAMAVPTAKPLEISSSPSAASAINFPTKENTFDLLNNKNATPPVTANLVNINLSSSNTFKPRPVAATSIAPSTDSPTKGNSGDSAPPETTTSGIIMTKVDNILSEFAQPLESLHGCHYTGAEEGGTNLYDDIISDFVCPPPHGPLSRPALVFKTGPSVVTGIRVYASTECFGCDPISYILEGYLDNVSWKLIASGQFDDAWTGAGADGPPPGRNPKFASTVGGETHGRLSFGFADFTATEYFQPVVYFRYRLQFPDLRYGSDPYNLQVGELQLVGAVQI